MSERALVVSVHDVSSQTHAACAHILAELGQLGVPACSLLVIPNHHGRGHLRENVACCSWLRAQAEAGHEIVTHGYFHRRARRAGESAMQKWTTRVYTADEGEFHDLDKQTARELVSRANSELRALGLDPHGFIAPAWLLSAGAEEALRELGVTHTTRLGSVLDLRTNTAHRAQSFVWSVRSGWRRQVSLAWNAWLFHRMKRRPLLRISIHPVDREHPAIWRQIRAHVAAAVTDREPLTYDAWLRRQDQG